MAVGQTPYARTVDIKKCEGWRDLSSDHDHDYREAFMRKRSRNNYRCLPVAGPLLRGADR